MVRITIASRHRSPVGRLPDGWLQSRQATHHHVGAANAATIGVHRQLLPLLPMGHDSWTKRFANLDSDAFGVLRCRSRPRSAPTRKRRSRRYRLRHPSIRTGASRFPNMDCSGPSGPSGAECPSSLHRHVWAVNFIGTAAMRRRRRMPGPNARRTTEFDRRYLLVDDFGEHD